MPYATKTTYAGYGADSQMHVYRIEREGEPLVCCFCLINDGNSFQASDPADMADHVDQHKAAGLRTPDGLAETFRAMAAASR